MRRLVEIGTGSGYPVRGRGGAAHLVLTDSACLLMDAGEGTTGTIKALDPDIITQIDAIFITHLHPDHISGLPMLLLAMYCAGREKPLTVYMPWDGIKPFNEMLSATYLTSEFWGANPFRILTQPLSTLSPYTFGDTSLSCFPTDHFADDVGKGIVPIRPSFGFLVEYHGKRLIYSGDTRTLAPISDNIVPGSTLLIEAVHLDYKEVVSTARINGVKQVVFTHIAGESEAELLKYAATFPNVLVATDLMEVNW